MLTKRPIRNPNGRWSAPNHRQDFRFQIILRIEKGCPMLRMHCSASSCSALFTSNLLRGVIDNRKKIAEFDVHSGGQGVTIARSFELIVLNAYRDPRTSHPLDHRGHMFAYHQVGMETQDFAVDVVRFSGGHFDTWSQH